MICPYCLSVFPSGASPCKSCGRPVPMGATPPVAGVFGRFFALVLDGIFCFLPAIITLAALVFTNEKLKGLVLGITDLQGAQNLLLNPDFLVPYAVSGGLLGVFGFIDLSVLLLSGQTIGKKLLDLRVVRKDYQPASVGRLLLRELIGKPLSGALAMIGYLMAFFTRDHAALHDKIAGTLVVRKLRTGEHIAIPVRPREFPTERASNVQFPPVSYPPPAQPVEPLTPMAPPPPSYAPAPAPAPAPPPAAAPKPAPKPVQPPRPAPPVFRPPSAAALEPEYASAPIPVAPKPAPPAAAPVPAPVSRAPVPEPPAAPFAPPVPAPPPGAPLFPWPAEPEGELTSGDGSFTKPTLPIESIPRPMLRPRTRQCPACKSLMEDPDSLRCAVCGFEQTPEEAGPPTRCPRCDADVPSNSRFCNHCGSSLLPEAPVQPLVPAPPGAEEPPPPEDAPPPRPRLITYSAEGEKEVFLIQTPRVRIGRAAENEIAFPGEKAISHRHCEIYQENGCFFIRDLGSTNGVYVNNEKTEMSPLSDGDKVKLGFKVFRFTL